MDELTYLIIEAGISDSYYNSESLRNLYPRDHRFIGHMAHHVENRFARMIEEGLFVRVAGQQNNYYLSDKGHKAFGEEKYKRMEKIEAERLQKSVSESVLNTNSSVAETNESVRTTNTSIQELNRISVQNFKVQNKIARSSVIVAVVAAFIALGSILMGVLSSGNSDVLKQLQETNKLLQDQNKTLNRILQHQAVVDSILAVRKSPPSSTKK